VTLPAGAVTQDETVRDAFLAGIKAAFVISQLNRFGQAMCGRCGCSWYGLEEAWANLDLDKVVVGSGSGYRGSLSWGEDHPNYLLLVCAGCKHGP
jgi:hypothetical protein